MNYGLDERCGEVIVNLALAGPMTDIHLLVDHPEGIWYSHQCGGYACLHPAQKGFLVPVFGTQQVVNDLDDYFAGELGSYCHRGITSDDADAVDAIFSRHKETLGLTVDRQFLHEDVEAWVYIKVAPDAYLLGDQWRLLYNFDLSTADEIALLWQNSD